MKTIKQISVFLENTKGRLTQVTKILNENGVDISAFSVADSSEIKRLLQSALTDKINDRETFMKGIDYSYYYEQEE